jgi:hypothetical protein
MPIFLYAGDVAKAGDHVAQSLYYRFLRPPPPQPKFVPTPTGLPPAATAKEAAAQIAAIVSRLGAGDLDLESSHALIEGLRAFVAAYGAAELEAEVEKFREGSERRRQPTAHAPAQRFPG